ncbi:MAG: HpcH/HpaI aldolase/citrate lyase family protein [Pseudomonadales bacterium]
MRENTSLRIWREGGQTIGCWLSLGNAHSAESLARLGFDWVCVDLQHGLVDYTDLTYMLPAISNGNATPIVRVPWNEPYEIMKALDAGAYGVIVPMINNREEAERAADACRYPPRGHRSFGPIRAALYGGQGYAAEANDQVACLAMIETEDGIANLDEILSTPGIDGAYIGPSDLALALGMPPRGDNDDPRHAATVQQIFEACRRHGVAAGIHTSSLAYTERYLKMGFNLVTLGSDAGWMIAGAARELASARGTREQAREKTGY